MSVTVLLAVTSALGVKVYAATTLMRGVGLESGFQFETAHQNFTGLLGQEVRGVSDVVLPAQVEDCRAVFVLASAWLVAQPDFILTSGFRLQRIVGDGIDGGGRRERLGITDVGGPAARMQIHQSGAFGELVFRDARGGTVNIAVDLWWMRGRSVRPALLPSRPI